MDKQEELSRKQFEECYRENYLSLSGVGLLERSTEIGSYIDAHAQGHWETWQASRASIVVDLPQRQSICASGYGDGYFVPSDAGEGLEYDETVEALRSIGLSIKGEE